MNEISELVISQRRLVLSALPDEFQEQFDFLKQDISHDLFNVLPAAFHRIYKDISINELVDICVAARIAVDYILIADRMLDDRIINPYSFFISQYLVTYIFGVLDDESSRVSFIDRLYKYTEEMILEEKGYSINELDFEGYMKSSDGKSQLAHLILDVISSRSKLCIDNGSLHDFLKLCNYMFQFVDDVADWEYDVNSKKSFLQMMHIKKYNKIDKNVEFIGDVYDDCLRRIDEMESRLQEEFNADASPLIDVLNFLRSRAKSVFV